MPSILPSHLADDIFGGKLIGAILSSALWGMACVQVYFYFDNSSKDHLVLKYTLASLTVINTVHTILVAHMVYTYLITSYGDPTGGVQIVWSESAAYYLTEIMNIVIRILYARRIWILSKGNKWIVGAIIAFAIPAFALACATSALLFRLPDISQLAAGKGGIYEAFHDVSRAAFAFGVLSELTITIGMCYYLRKLRTSFHKTRTFIQVLIKYTITTGLIAIIIPLVSQTIFYINPLVSWAVMFYYPEGKLYLNSYLAALNARDSLKSDGCTSLHMSNFTTTAGDRATDPVPYDKARDGVVILHDVDTFIDGGNVRVAKEKL